MHLLLSQVFWWLFRKDRLVQKDGEMLLRINL